MQPLTDVTLDVSQREPFAVSQTHYCVMGDVSVDVGAAIAPGVVLQALPGSRIIISKDVCLSGGVCIQARSGVLTIAARATLGANVLVVGSGEIGANACVSPGSTLMNPQIAENALLSPNTLSEAAQAQKSTVSAASSNSYQASSQNSFNQNSFNQNGSGQSEFGQSGFSQSEFSSDNSSQSSFNQSGSDQSSFDSSGFNSGSYSPSSPDLSGFSQNNFTQPAAQSSSNFQQGDTSFSPSVADQPLPKNTFVEPGPIEPKPVQIPAIDVSAEPVTYDPLKNGVQLNQNYDLSIGNSGQSSALVAPSNDRVYGKDQVSNLLSTLFPNRQSLNGNN